MYPIVNLVKIYLNISIFKTALRSQLGLHEWADNSNKQQLFFVESQKIQFKSNSTLII